MNWSTEHDAQTGEAYVAVTERGDWTLRDPLTNKGTAFTLDERRALHLDGLVPPVFSTMEQPLARVYENYLGKPSALERFRDRLCTFNDDIQGTASVVVAGVYGALRMNGGAMHDQRILLGGAGASAQGVAGLLVSALRDEGLSLDEARRRIATVDSHGLVTTARAEMEPFKAAYARPVEELAGYVCADRAHVTLEEAIDNFRPTMLIGTSGTPGLFSEAVVRAMARVNERPLVFPLSNPTSKAECTAAQAIEWSDGRAIVATGSPFPPVTFGGRTYRTGQGNNAFIFPGVGLGLWVGRVRRVTDAMFLDAARALASLVTDEDLAEGAVYPRLTRIRDCSHAVACAVIRRAVVEGHAEPAMLDDLEARVRRAMWEPEYKSVRYEPDRR